MGVAHASGAPLVPTPMYGTDIFHSLPYYYYPSHTHALTVFTHTHRMEWEGCLTGNVSNSEIDSECALIGVIQ